MNQLTHLKQTILPLLVTIVIVCFGLLPQMEANLPPEIPGNPDGCYPAFTTAEGCNALAILNTGIGNTAIGWFSLFLADAASFNTAVGAGALALTTHTPGAGSATNNTAVGTGAMLLNTSGTDNVAVGTNALLFNNDGFGNNAVGSFALHNNDTGIINNAVGEGALESNIDGFANTAVGDAALRDNVSGDGNTAVGRLALSSNLVSNNTAVGSLALFQNTTGIQNTAVGAQALRSNTVGESNTAIGVNALFSNTGDANNNTAIGRNALVSNTTAGGNVAVGSLALSSQAGNFAINNTAVGTLAGSGVTIGHNNTVVGAFSGQHMGIGNSNIYLGAGVDPGVAEQNFTRINDSNGQAAGSNSRVFLGSIDNVTNVGAAVDAANLLINTVTGQLGTTVTSSARFKKDIKPMDKASESILALKPVTFHYKEDKASRLCFGLIAEDVAKVDPALVELDEEGKPNSVRYQEIPIRLLNEFLKEHKTVQEQQSKIDNQQATITQLKKDFGATIAQLTARLDEQAAQIQKVSAQLEVSKPAAQTVANNQ